MAISTSAIRTLGAKTILLTAVALISTDAAAGIKHEKIARTEASRPVSTLQVVNHIERKYKGKGKGISLKKTPIEGFDDCYVVRVLTFEGELDIIKINCK